MNRSVGHQPNRVQVGRPHERRCNRHRKKVIHGTVTDRVSRMYDAIGRA